jgi:type VI secretion system protein
MIQFRFSSACMGIGLLLTSGLTACSTPSWLCLAPPGPDAITLAAAPDANGDAAIAVDLVFVTDNLAAQQLSTLSAQEYFARRAQLLRDFGSGMQVQSWELAPGQLARDMPVHPTCNRVRTLLFARYATPGDHRQVLKSNGTIVISLDNNDFSVTQ